MNKLILDFTDSESNEIEYQIKGVKVSDAVQSIGIICDHINKQIKDVSEEDQSQVYEIMAGIIISKGRDLGLFEEVI